MALESDILLCADVGNGVPRVGSLMAMILGLGVARRGLFHGDLFQTRSVGLEGKVLVVRRSFAIVGFVIQQAECELRPGLSHLLESLVVRAAAQKAGSHCSIACSALPIAIDRKPQRFVDAGKRHRKT